MRISLLNDPRDLSTSKEQSVFLTASQWKQDILRVLVKRPATCGNVC